MNKNKARVRSIRTRNGDVHLTGPFYNLPRTAEAKLGDMILDDEGFVRIGVNGYAEHEILDIVPHDIRTLCDQKINREDFRFSEGRTTNCPGCRIRSTGLVAQ